MNVDFRPDTAWEVVRPGVIRIPTTCVEVHLVLTMRQHHYEVRWQDRTVDNTCFDLDHAKFVAQNWVADLLTMGMDPGFSVDGPRSGLTGPAHGA